MRHPVYARSQWLWLVWIGVPLAAVALLPLILAEPQPGRRLGLWLLLLTLSLVPVVLGRLTIEVGDGQLEWRYGLLPWPRWAIPLADIASVEATTTRWTEGWGIRKTRDGMLYNASGHAAVRIVRRDGTALRLGSDEPERLAAFIRARLSPA